MDNNLHTARNAAPKNFTEHIHRREWIIDGDITTIWTWLNTPETFTKGNPPGFRVEFVAPDGNTTADFNEGVICAHYGPLMMFAGVISKVDEPTYRDLQYYYGSYALSFWFIRPTRLQFWLEEETSGGTLVKLQVNSYVRNGFHWMWTIAQRIFWTFFPLGLKRGIKRHKKVSQLRNV